MKRFPKMHLLFVLMVSFMVSAVSGGGGAYAAEPSPLVIGVIGVMSGPYAIWGENLREGATLAAETINKKGGVRGRKISLLFRDDEANPTKSVTAVTELVERQKVNALIASATTGATLAVLPYVAKEKIPHFLASSSGTNIDSKANPYTFKAMSSDSAIAKTMAEFLVKTRGYKKIGIFCVSDGYGNALKGYYTDALKVLGVKPVSIQGVNNGETTATSQVLRMKQDGVEAIMVGALEPEIATLMRSMERAGFTVPVLATQIPVTGSFFDLMGNKIPVNLFAARGRSFTYTGQQPLSPEVKGFLDLVNRRFGAKNRFIECVAAAYDAVNLFAYSFEKNGNLDGDSFKKTMESLSNYKGVYGTYTFTPERHMSSVEFAIVGVSKVKPDEVKNGISPRL